MKFSRIEDAVRAMQQGRFIIVVDDENRENEGDLVIAAEKITPMKLNYMMHTARGFVCMPMTRQRLEELKIPMMVQGNGVHHTPFTVSVDAKTTSTGVSVTERVETMKALMDPKTIHDDLIKPGHVFPLRALDEGVLARPGHTEASIDLAKIAKVYPATVICEVMKEDGQMAKLDSLFELADKKNWQIISINDLIEYRKNNHI